MAWCAHLSLGYTADAASTDGRSRTVARFTHEGPLRILKSFHPEGQAICHNVLVHPPGGLVAGDAVTIEVDVGEGAHGLLTTPGATQFYRADEMSGGGHDAVASQRVEARLAVGARLEWLPLESICHAGCAARNRLVARLAPGAEMIGWDLTALGLPATNGRAFDRGSIEQHLELRVADDRRIWLERGRIDAADHRLMDGPLGLAGHRCMATMFWAAGTAIDRVRRERALDSAREALTKSLAPDAQPVRGEIAAGATSPGPHVVVVRILTPMVEPAFRLAQAVRSGWRSALWDLPATTPRGWPRR